MGLFVLEKTNIKLFSRKMRHIEWDHVRRKLFLVSQMLLLLENDPIFVCFVNVNWIMFKSDLKLHLYPLYWY